MAHLLHCQDLDDADMEALFDYLYHRDRVPERRSRGCGECGGGVEWDDVHAYNICADCGLVQPDILPPSADSCWDDQERISVWAREGYRPIHHWHERMAQYHLQESRICGEHWGIILGALRTAKPAALCKETIRRLLRSVKLQRYNENWLQIVHRITGHMPPAIDPAEMHLLDTVFEGIAAPFRLFKQKGRKNLLNYNFILYKLLQLIGRTDTLCYFPQLKTRVKWLELDRVWGLICEYQGWEVFALEEPPKLSIKLTPEMWSGLDRQVLAAAWEFATQGPGAWKKKVSTHTYCNKAILKSYQYSAARSLALLKMKPLPLGAGRAAREKAKRYLKRRK
jgi:hypothetical protein